MPAYRLRGSGAVRANHPVQIIYSGAGIAVPSTFLGTHFASPNILFGASLTTGITAVDTGTDTLTIAANNGRLALAETAEFSTTGVLPAGLQAGVEYPIVDKGPVGPSASYVTFKVTSGGQVVDISDAGSGSHSVRFRLSDLESTLTVARTLNSSFPFWSRIHTSDGVFDWTNFDSAAQYHCVDRGRKLLKTIYQTPTWLSSNAAIDPYGYPGGSHAPTDNSKLSAYVTEFMQRYNAVSAFNPGGTKHIFAVEVWNEPSFSTIGTAGVQFAGTYTQLAAMAKVIYQAVKAVDSSCQVIATGFTNEGGYNGEGVPRTLNFLKASDGAGGFGKDWIDGVSYHGYSPMGDTTANMLDLPAQIDRHKSILEAAGLSASFPLYMTERGVLDAADTLAHARSAIIEAAKGVKCSIGYTWDSFGCNPRDVPACRAAIEKVAATVPGKTLTYCARMLDGSYEYTTNGTTYRL